MPTNTAPKIHWLAYYWPGLPQLWGKGSWVGLLVAVGFTAVANVLMLASLVFHEWLPQQTQLTGYGLLVVVWLLARWQSRAERRAMKLAAIEVDDVELNEDQAEPQPAERDLLFRETQGHYLRNDWVAAEQTLLKLLKQDARDIESRLMLATLWRHQGRSAEALRQLDRLSRLEAAEPWQHEIAAERAAIAVAEIDETETIDEIAETTEAETSNLEQTTSPDDDQHLDERRAA